MVRRAVVPGLVGIAVAFAIGTGLQGVGAGASAAIGVALALGSFSLNGVVLARAAAHSPTAWQAWAVLGFPVRLAAFVAILFGFSRLSWFSPSATALGLVPAFVLLVAFEARLIARGLGGQLVLPPPGTGA